jgi:hypothetical protein
VNEMRQEEGISSVSLGKQRAVRFLAWAAAALTLGFSLGWAFARLSAPETMPPAALPAPPFISADSPSPPVPTTAPGSPAGRPLPRAGHE